MKQVIVIHGGTTFANYEDYLRDLATKTLHPERFTFKPMWKELLQANLGDEYQVLLPSMPNKGNASYKEWAIWFKHFSELATEGCVLVGHSLGAIFLAKYLSENEYPVKISKTILVAAPYDDEEVEDLTDFKLTKVSERFKNQAGEVLFFFGNDDPVIAPTEIDKYKADLPDATFNVMSAPDHFVRVEFPEIITAIKADS